MKLEIILIYWSPCEWNSCEILFLRAHRFTLRQSLFILFWHDRRLCVYWFRFARERVWVCECVSVRANVDVHEFVIYLCWHSVSFVQSVCLVPKALCRFSFRPFPFFVHSISAGNNPLQFHIAFRFPLRWCSSVIRSKKWRLTADCIAIAFHFDGTNARKASTMKKVHLTSLAFRVEYELS